MKFTAFARRAFHLNGSLHSVHNRFCNGHPQPAALGLMHHRFFFPGKFIKNIPLKFRLHANPRILNAEMAPDVFFS